LRLGFQGAFHDPGRRDQDECRNSRDQSLSRALERSRRTSEHQFTLQMAFDIDREFRRGDITPLAGFLERLLDNPVQVAIDAFSQGDGVGSAAGGDVRGGRPETAEPLNQRGRFLLHE